MEQFSTTRTRHGNVGLDGAESYYCDLSGRGLSTAQIERTLRVFETAEAIDLSNNEMDRIPSTIPHSILALDLSFNLIANADGIDRLKHLQEIHLGFNRLTDVSILEFCPRLQRVNLSGNRLMHTKGLETLAFLEHLDLSENLIEFPEALRALSLNQHLTHLTLRGNPIGLNPKTDYRVLLLDMIPSILVLDDKKIRSAVKLRNTESGSSNNSSSAASKTLSYSRLYDDKKQFVIRGQNRAYPGKTVKPLVAGDTSSRYDATMFVQPAIEPTHERVRSRQLQETTPAAPEPALQARGPPPAPLAATAGANTGNTKPAAASYMSLYDRLAQANGTRQLTTSVIPPSKPIETARLMQSNNIVGGSDAAPVDKPKRHAAAATAIRSRNVTGASKLQQALLSPAQSVKRGPVHRSAAPVRSIPPAAVVAATSSSSKRPNSAAASVRAVAVDRTAVPTSAHHDAHHSGSVRSKQSLVAAPYASSVPATAPPRLDEKQRKNLIQQQIQNLIQHKKQTLATLSRAAPVAT